MIDFNILLQLALLAIALVLLILEIFPADVVALGLLLALTLTGLLPARQAFAGFGSDTVITILGLLVLTAALSRTGVVEIVGRAIIRRTGDNAYRILVIIVITTAVLGAFMSNTASTAFFLPITIGLAKKVKISPSRLLMPLAFASILTSSVTLISTSSNILISGLMTQYKLPPMGMFELAPVGVPISIIGIIYMLTIGRRMIPEREEMKTITEDFDLRPYLSEILIMPGSPLAHKTLGEAALGRDLDLTVLQVLRDGSRYLAPDARLVLQENDVLLVEGQRDAILQVNNIAGVDIKANITLVDPDLESEELGLAEVILLPRSPLIERTLKGIRFRERYGLQVLAINRGGEQTIHQKISDVRLHMGDVLLIQGPPANIALLQEDRTFQLIGRVEENRLNFRRAPIAISIFVGILVVSAFEIIPLPVVIMLGALLAFVTKCITPEEAYREVEWKALILIGSMLGLGVTMESTGTASFLAGGIVNLVGTTHPLWLLAAFFLLTLLLTQPMAHQAAVVVVLPVAIQTALQLGLNPRTFAMMIAIAASCSYLTPLEPSCLMVYGPGKYKFVDFLKVGSILTVLIFILAIVLVPIVWPIY